jgi:hypothetical protein
MGRSPLIWDANMRAGRHLGAASTGLHAAAPCCFGAPGSKRVDLSIGNELSVEAVTARLRDMVTVVRRKAEPDVLPAVASIADSITAMLPRLVPGQGPIDSTTLTVRQTALDYLPTTLQAYLGLPPRVSAFARGPQREDGARSAPRSAPPS